jgi:hypothetical protein
VISPVIAVEKLKSASLHVRCHHFNVYPTFSGVGAVTVFHETTTTGVDDSPLFGLKVTVNSCSHSPFTLA